MADVVSVAAVQVELARVSALIREGDLGAPVAHLNRWKVRDVAAHLGGVHRWATRIVDARSMDGPGFRKSKLDGAELCDWFDEGAAALLDTLRPLDLEAPCPNFNPGSDKSVGWWVRRQLFETTIHRWDIESALDSISPIDAAAAVEGIDEFLDVFVRTRGKHTLDALLVLETTRPKRRWTLRPADKPGRIDVTSGNPDAAEAATTVAARPADLLLALWGRMNAAQASLKVDGDADISSLINAA